MSFKSETCPKCGNSWEFYQQGNIVPPCPHCGYPEVKASGEDWAKSLGAEPSKPQERS